MDLFTVRPALRFALGLLLSAASPAGAVILTFTDRAAWEAAVGAFTEESFDAFVADQSFNDGLVVDVGDFMLKGLGDATLDGVVYNHIDAAPFDDERPSPNGTTDLSVRVADEDFDLPPNPPGPIGFDVLFDLPQGAWGADFGITGTEFRVNADGVEIGLGLANSFFGFVDTAGTFTTLKIDTPLGANGANTTLDNFVYGTPAPVPGPATLTLLVLGGGLAQRAAGSRRKSHCRTCVPG